MNLVTEWFLAAAAVPALYGLFSPRIAEPLYRSLIFDPVKYPKGLYGVSELQQFLGDTNAQDIFIPLEKGKKLHAWYFPNKNARQTVMVCHGNEGNISDMGKLVFLLLQSGNAVFIFDYQGYGVSTGAPSVKGICEDALIAYEWLVKKMHVDPRTLVLYGESMGASVVCWLMHKRLVAGVILQSAATNLRRIAYETFPPLIIFPDFLFPQPYFDNVKALCQKHCPLLIIHGSKDKTVNPQHAKELFAAAREPKQMALLPNTGHDEIDDRDAAYFCQAVKEFLHSLPNSMFVRSL